VIGHQQLKLLDSSEPSRKFPLLGVFGRNLLKVKISQVNRVGGLNNLHVLRDVPNLTSLEIGDSDGVLLDRDLHQASSSSELVGVGLKYLRTLKMKWIS